MLKYDRGLVEGGMIPALQIVERRKTGRLQTNIAGIAKSQTGEAAKCSIKNISPMGAFLSFEQPTIIPKQFKLLVPECWFEAECEVRHSSKNGVGVVFTSNRREALARFAIPLSS